MIYLSRKKKIERSKIFSHKIDKGENLTFDWKRMKKTSNTEKMTSCYDTVFVSSFSLFIF